MRTTGTGSITWMVVYEVDQFIICDSACLEQLHAMYGTMVVRRHISLHKRIPTYTGNIM